jgi:cell division protein FtsZ
MASGVFASANNTKQIDKNKYQNYESNSEFGSISFDLPKNQSNVIKVIGVGGGGSNAINHMFKQGIKGVDFIVCNTDSQALQNSPVPNKIQLGVHLTEGLGAGANPEVGQQSAIESISDIEKMLDTNTKMVFITAGMGGGTGTGAAPVIAQLAKERDILTVGIVTIPFQFEGKVRQDQAMIGVEKLRKQVDSLIVINNNKLSVKFMEILVSKPVSLKPTKFWQLLHAELPKSSRTTIRKTST